MKDMMQPLKDVTVIAVEQYGAGPFGSMLLGDLGADVIKIENPVEGGDVGRKVGPYYFSEGDSYFHQSFNRNKRSLTLNLKHEEGRRIFEGLVRNADAVMNNLRGDLPEKLGLDYASLSKVNPKIVCAHLSAYGREGSRKNWPGYDYLMQAEVGYLSVTGEPDGPPSRFGVSIVDMMTGLMTAFALVSGVVGARAQRKGMDMDVNLFDTALHNLSYLATWYLNNGHIQGREPRGAHPSLTPSQMFTTKDGWIFVMCNKEKFWPILADKLGHPEWVNDPRFSDFSARLKHRDEVTEMVDAALCQKTTAEWMKLLGGSVPISPVNDIGQALESDFIAEGRRTEFFPRKDGSTLAMLSPPVRVNGSQGMMNAAPHLGADTAELLEGLGWGMEDQKRLRKEGVI
ncbi:succinate--hydroxymethylglutarate CoA-transferase [Roseovarius sp. MBR-78]|jgi:crotonobetainyl-CoA:carnitine CoA-transferase CaiB-like acyl-CoA transferase|uniref:CaiB/BaiF CoA transferase family protein n=1 Tax=Roseovarius sp. MBR-78 TaxID=3156460 RepID=UPI0033925C23